MARIAAGSQGRWCLALAASLGAGLLACADVCAQGASVAAECGLPFDERGCGAKLEACSDAERERLGEYYTCLENKAECADGALGNEGASLSCLGALVDLSAACLATTGAASGG